MLCPHRQSAGFTLEGQMQPLTKRQREILDYLHEFIDERGYAPSLEEIGRRFGGRDHTTVLHAVRKIEDLITNDTKLGHEVELLKRLILE